ncbi:MAG: sensor domain-containing diguanylate cyclase [Gemmatimonadetes bacterium]|nr:sensor domain-containing diguanylate cyclase [Gemmatimonadota bacterium]
MNELETLSALYHATCRIGLSDRLDDLLSAVLGQAHELIRFDHCAVMLYEPETGRLRVRKVLGYADATDEVQSVALPRGHGLSGWAAEHRQAVRVADVRKDPRYVPGLPDARSSLVVPMVVSNQVAGVFNVESTREDAFTETHEKLLTVLGSQAGLAILGSRARERLQHRIEQLHALYRISQLASGQDDLDTTLSAILGVTEELVPDGHVAVLLLDEASRSLTVRASRGYTEGVGGLRIPVGRGLTGRCAETGEAQLANDLAHVTDYIEGVPGARSEIALPLKVDGRVIGVLNAESSTPGAYGDDHVQPLTVVAHQAAVVIRAAQLNEEMRCLAVTDPLTGLHNRRYFAEKLEEHVRRARRYGEELVLLLLDCDRLKKINDVHGHLAGDRALQAIADVMKITLRDTDVLARLGGDEFAVLLVEADQERGERVMERLAGTVRGLRLMSEEGGDLGLSISIGQSTFPESGSEAKALLREADIALYRSKRLTRERAPVSRAISGVIEFERNRSSGRPGPVPEAVLVDPDDEPREGPAGG